MSRVLVFRITVVTALAGKVERFASVEYIKQIHAPAGIELILEQDDGRLNGTLRDYAVDPTPRETPLHGSLNGCAVRVSGEGNHSAVEISGQLTVPAFRGTIRRKIGKQWYSEKVFLRRQMTEKPDITPSSCYRDAVRGTIPAA